MKPIWKILIAAAVIIAAVAALFVVPHYRAKAALRAYREQLKTMGEKLTIAELTPPLSADATSAGQEFLRAVSTTVNFTSSPPMMKWLAPGHALVGWAETNSPTEDLTNCWPEFTAAVKGGPEITTQISESLRGPGIGFQVQYQLGFGALLPHLATMKRASLWLAAAQTLALHQHDGNAAWTNLSLETELLKKNESEPLMISQMVRAAMVQTGVAATWEALQYPGWSEEQLAQLQTNWDSFTMLARGTEALSMERAMQGMGIDQMRDSYKVYDGIRGIEFNSYDSFEVLVNPQEAVPEYLGQYPRYWMWKWWGSYDEELYLSQMMQAALEAMRKAQAREGFIPALDGFRHQVEDLQKIHPGSKQRFAFARRLDRVVLSYMRRIGEVEMERRMMVVALALERYRRRHGNYPERLEELAPDILKKAPIDFMDGKPLRYHRADDGKFLMYSLGLDGKDDGGDGTSPEPDGLRPKTWSRMRDAVWPVPATAAEVKNYEDGMLQKYLQKWPRGRVPLPNRVSAPAGTNSNAK